MESVRSNSGDDNQRFQYQPLANPGSSIRLIEVDPELSTEATLQIQLFDSALSEEYTCLSYVWGQENDERGGPFPILVNSKTFHIRRNLNDFLHVARRIYPKRRFWIDAICIDQANTPERNHQVQQMGEIYSGAKEVIAWLGYEKIAAEFIPFVNGRARHEFRHLLADIGRLLWFVVRIIDGNFCFGMLRTTIPNTLDQQNAFRHAIHKYWLRAWVTQEITLAKHVRLLVHETEFDLAALKLAKMRNFRSTFPWQLLQIYDAHIRDHNSHDQHLLKLLYKYGDKECKIGRDRIFSLVSICLEGADLHVDYSLSEEKLLSTVLRISRLTPCLCSAYIASRSIDVNAISKEDPRAPYFLKFTVQAKDVYTYQATQRRWRSCCSAFSITAFAEQSDGQLFCLSNVCPNMKWHLFVVSQEPDKQHVKGIMCKSIFEAMHSLTLGENGELVDIRASSCGDSYTINFTLEGLLKLFTEQKFSYRRPNLCNVGRQTKCDSRVEFLDLGS